MMRRHRWLLGTLSVLAACARKPSAESMAGPMTDMTPEEHARMSAGGNQGAMDSLGTMIRQPVHLTAADEKALGVVYTAVGRETLTKTVRTVGEILTPEPNVVDVTTKVEGFVDRLLVNATGENVRKGEPLLALYSPDLVAAQEEFLVALKLATRVDSTAGEAWRAARATLDAARRRLAWWDITAAQIDALERSGTVTRTMTLVAPADGIVLVKNVVQGQRVLAGERLYQIADLREVWVEGDVFEQDLPFVHVGSQAHIEIAAQPGAHLMGHVSFLYPTVDEQSRTNRVRLTVPNPGMRLKPGMFATIFFDAVIGRDIVTIPRDAVIVTGERNVVFVRGDDGTLRSREVLLGPRSEEKVQVLGGLVPGETIVASANFLVDAESRLASPGDNMPGMQHAIPNPPAPAGGSGHDR
jgi:RND family efflux transporter MFP subunit